MQNEEHYNVTFNWHQMLIIQCITVYHFQFTNHDDTTIKYHQHPIQIYYETHSKHTSILSPCSTWAFKSFSIFLGNWSWNCS
jgi:hypothetical protein